MSNTTKVDVVLALRTVLSGNTEGLAYLQQFEQQGKLAARSVGGEWDQLTRKLERKFSAPEILLDFAKGAGFGSAFSVINLGLDAIVNHLAEAANDAKRVSEYIEQTSTSMKELFALRFGNFIDRLAPERQLEEKKKQLAGLTQKIGEFQTAQAEAGRLTALASTGADSAFDSFTDEKPKSFIVDKQLYSPKDLADKADRDREAAATKEIETAKEREGVIREIAAIEKQLADEKQKAADKQLETVLKIAAATGVDMKSRKEITPEQEAAAAANLAAYNEELEKSSLAFRELADRSVKYKEQLAQIDLLTRTFKADGTPFLSDADAAAATARLKADFEQDLPRAIDASNEALRNFGRLLNQIDNNPLLTDVEKRAARVDVLRRENAAIEEQIGLLRKFADEHPGIDPAAIRGQIRSLQDREVGNDAKIGAPNLSRVQQAGLANRNLDDPTKHFQSIGEGAEGGLLEIMNQLGTAGDQVANIFTNTIGTAISGTGNLLYGLVARTGDWRQSLLQIGGSVFQNLLQSLIQIGERQLLNATIGRTGMLSLNATADALRAGNVAKDNAAQAATLPLKTAGAAAAGISSFGVALAFGAIAIALIAAAAGAFEVGGYTSPLGGGGSTSDIAGVVHKKEWVAPAWMTTSSEYGPMIAGLEAARQGKPGRKTGGWLGKLLTTGIDDKFLSFFQATAGSSQIIYDERTPLQRSATEEFLRAPIASPGYQPPSAPSRSTSSSSLGSSESPEINVPISVAIVGDEDQGRQWLKGQEGRRFLQDQIRQVQSEI